jgi:flagellar biosynthesis protein FlhG
MSLELQSSANHDQAASLRALVRGAAQDSATAEELGREARHALSLAVVSGKGGVGKSNVAVNLSICLARRGLRVTLVDLDMGLANADLLLGLVPRHTLAQVISATRTLEEITVTAAEGLRLVPGASGLHQVANLSEFERQSLLMQLQKLEDSTDILVFDCGAGISRNVVRFALACVQVMVVTTPEPTALTDAYAMIKILRREQFTGTLGLLVNKVTGRKEAEATYARISGVAKRFLNFPIAYFGHVVQDTAVALAVQARRPVVVQFPGSNASACFAAAAQRFSQDRSSPQRREGFFRRVAGLFA